MGDKFDTNPLEGGVSGERDRSKETEALVEQAPETTPFPPPTVTEERTRRFDDPEVSAFLSPGSTEHQPAAYTAPAVVENPKVRGIGLSQRTAISLSYFPGIGFTLGFLILFLAPSNENKARFHAAQSVAAHAFIGVVMFFLKTIGAGGAAGLFGLVTSIMMIVFTYRAWKGKPVYIESVSRATDWIEEKTSPRSRQ